MGADAFTELLDAPSDGRIFETEARPGIADAGGDRRVRIDAIARWLQDLAHGDLRDAGFREQGIWVVRRVRIRVEEFPQWPHGVRMRTWCSGLGRFTAERRSSLEGSVGRVEAVALWIWLDAEKLRPKRFPPEFVEAYGEAASRRDPNTRLRHPDPPEGAEGAPWTFRATDVDVAAHINNSHYWAPLEEELVGQELGAFDAEIEYRDPAQPGEMRVITDGDSRWITSPKGRVHASIALAR
jgi:acyl-ACP thioesterase